MMRIGVQVVMLAMACGLAAGVAAAADRPLAAHSFAPVASVLMHPRCSNCHPAGDTPRQANAGRMHLPFVARGADGRGVSAMRCTACHGAGNNASSGVPGAPNWHLAPRSMGWTGLSAAQLCRAITDPRRNGGRDLEALVAHLTEDPLVQWAWNPGVNRALPPLSQQEFHAAVRAWAAVGARCPAR